MPVVNPSVLVSLRQHLDVLNTAPVVLYIGPDQILPVTSFIGGVIGVLLMFWHKLVDVTRRVRARVTRDASSERTESRV